MIRGFTASNIAWPVAAEAEALAELRRLGFVGIELAPGKSIAGWPLAPRGLEELRRRLEDEGLPIVALQALLFGIEGPALFATDAARGQLFDHLVRVARIAGILGAGTCGFGAPGTRDPGALPASAAFESAAAFFTALAPIFEAEGTCLAFEAIPRSSGCGFVTQTHEAVALVEAIGRPGIRVLIDTGTIFANGEDPEIVIAAAPFAAHVQVSEPGLAPIGTMGCDHAALGTLLRASAFDGFVSIEMREVEAWPPALDRAAEMARRCYGMAHPSNRR